MFTMLVSPCSRQETKDLVKESHEKQVYICIFS